MENQDKNNNHNGHKIHLYDVYEKIGKLEGTVNQIDKKLDQAILNHEKRINDVESNCDKIQGKATALGMLGGFIVSIIAAVIGFFQLK